MKGGEASRLAGRLAALRGDRGSAPAGGEPGRSTGKHSSSTRSAGGNPEPSAPRGWSSPAPLVYRRDSLFPLPEGWGEDTGLLLKVCGPPGTLVNPAFPAGLSGGRDVGENPSSPPSPELLFYDLETTGLSGGAGNIAFLAGIGRVREDGFSLTQLFLADYPGERDFLEQLSALMDPSFLWVSYNGRAFDTSLLRTRFLLNRVPFREGHQLDLLYPSRRLWKRILPDCSLGTLERELFRKTRAEDVPGSLIPDLYFRSLRENRPELLHGVFAHHREDILSLAELYVLLDRILSRKAPEPCDPAGAGSLLLPFREDLGRAFLEKGLEEGDIRSGMFLGSHLKRREEWSRAEEIWIRLWETASCREAGLELAKLREHRKRDYSGALELTEILLRTAGEEKNLPELQKRRDRLVRKLRDGKPDEGRSAPGPVQPPR